MVQATERKEQTAPLFSGAPLPKELRLGEIVRNHANSAPSIKPIDVDFTGDTSILIDDRDQLVITKIKAIGGFVTQIEQRHTFSHNSSRFEICFDSFLVDNKDRKNEKGVVYRLTLKPLDRQMTLPRFTMHYGYQRDSGFTGILTRGEASKEEEFGLPRCPDALDLRDVLTNIFAGEFALTGLWNPEEENEKR